MHHQLYRRWLDELWNGPPDDLETIARRVVTDDFVGHWPGRPGFVTGPDDLATVIRQGKEMFVGLAFELDVGPVSEGNLITARWAGHGHYEGAPTTFHGHDILRHNGDRFVEYWVIAENP